MYFMEDCYSVGERGRLLLQSHVVPMYRGLFLILRMTVNSQLHSSIAELISHYGINYVCMHKIDAEIAWYSS